MTEENTDLQTLEPTLRVKFYQLSIDTNWEDKGTGFCIYQTGSEGKPDQIIVHSEVDNKLLLKSEVLKRHLYQRQQETLIVWTEDDSRDLALSFQDPAGCEKIWQSIGKKEALEDSLSSGDKSNSDSALQVNSPDMTTLPDPQLSNLKEILTILNSAHTLQEKDKISNFMAAESYVDKLLPLFDTTEDLEDINDLHTLYNIVISMLTLNDQALIETFLKDEYIYTFMGILEYNPKKPTMKAKHREFIKARGNVEQVVDLGESSFKKKIDLTFRLEYLQSILHHEDLDDGLMSILGNMIFQHHLDLVNYVQNNHTFLNALMKVIKSQETTEEKRWDAIKFVHQVFQLAKQMQNSVRLNLLRSLANYGLFELLCFALVHKNSVVRARSVNLLATFTDLDVSTVRSHLLSQAKLEKKSAPLIEIMITEFSSDSHHGLKVQYFEILRLLLDPHGNSPTGGLSSSDPLHKQSPETDEFLQLFYDKYADILLKPILDLEIKTIGLKGPIELLPMTQDQAQLYLYLCEFLYFAVRNHGYRCKFNLLSTDLFAKVAQLYRSKYQYVKLCALRFFRVCLAASDGFYNKNLIKFNIFEATIRVLLDTNNKDCLLNSACLELLEYIRKENLKSLITHIIQQFGTVLDTITYTSTCKQFRLKYEQITEPQETNTSSKKDSKSKSEKELSHNGWSSSTVDEEEEDYFSQPDKEEETATEDIPKSISLVNYDGSDEDDEEEKPKRKSDEEDKSTIHKTSVEESPKRKLESEDEAETEEEVNELPLFKSRKLDDEDDEDMLSKKSRQSPKSKRIVIKTSSIKRMRSN